MPSLNLCSQRKAHSLDNAALAPGMPSRPLNNQIVLQSSLKTLRDTAIKAALSYISERGLAKHCSDNLLEQSDSRGGSGTAVDGLYRRLRSDIISGEIAAGSRINEVDISRRHRVGRGTVRETLTRLESLGLVQRRANAGVRVVSLSAADLIEIYQVREALEGMACRLAAQRMSDAQIYELACLLNEHSNDDQLQQGRAYYQQEGDLDFHYRLVQGSGNRQLIHLLCDELYAKLRMYRYQFGMLGARVRDAYSEHWHIVQVLRDRDGEMAEMLMRRHIRASRQNIETQIHARGQQDDKRHAVSKQHKEPFATN